MISFHSAQIITSNMFEAKTLSTGLSGLKFIGIIFSLYEKTINDDRQQKLRTMAKNILKIGKTQKLFEEKIEFVCRKVTLNFNMQKRI